MKLTVSRTQSLGLKVVAWFVLLFVGIVGSLAPAQADDNSVVVELGNISIEGGEKAPVKASPIDDGMQLTLENRANGWNAVRFPVKVSAKKYNTLQFKARFNGAAEGLKKFDVNLIGANGTWDASSFLRNARLQDDGWYAFSWDIVNQPDIIRGLDLESVLRLDFKFNFGVIPQGQVATITLGQIKFLAGQSVRSGDPELYKEWQEYIEAYQPDYSDSSRSLIPPTTGRIPTPVPLAGNGKAMAEIVVPDDASKPLKLAATELSYWLGEVTGAKFPLVGTATNQVALHIFLGKSYAVGKYDDDLRWLGESDGFAVRVDKNHIHLFGNTDKGTLNGVFTFLENNTDIIWPRPRRELGAVYSKNPDLKVVWADAREKPATRLRGWATNLGLRSEHEIWSVRNRDNYPKGGGGSKIDGDRRVAHGDYVEFGGGHNVSGFLGKENPRRFYPTIDGQVPEKFDIWKHQPNFTAPGIEDAVANNVLKFIEEKAPDHIDCININIEDNWGVSTDAKSLEPIALPDGTLLESSDPAFRSTQYFIFLNKVAKKIRAVHPNLMVGTYAYFFTAVAPKVPVEDNIRIYFCPYVRKDQRSPLSAPVNDVWWQRLEGWAKASPNVVIREYYGISNGFRPLAEVVAFDVKSYITHGVQEYTAEINPDETLITSDGTLRGGGDEWDLMAMEFWVINRLYWNPNQDVEQLRKYYLRRTYREAAPQMERFYGTIRSEWYRTRVSSSFTDSVTMMRAFVIDRQHEATLNRLLEDASVSAQHPIAKLSVDVVRRRFMHWLALAKKEPSAIVPDNALYYGWSANGDGGSNPAWTTSTFTSIEGKTVPAVRLTVRGDRLTIGQSKIEIANTFIKGMKNGDELRITLRPAKATKKYPQLTLSATDALGHQLVAPMESMMHQVDGSIVVKWKISPAAGLGFDAALLKRVGVQLSSELLSSEPQIEFYLTDMGVASQN